MIAAQFGSIASCSRCSDEEPVDRRVRSDRALPWEGVRLGAGEDGFRSSVSEMTGLEPDRIASMMRCGLQAEIAAIDPGSRTLSERSGHGRSLSQCTLLQASAGRSWNLASIRGDFIDGSLAAVSFHFGPGDPATLVSDLEGRLGPGDRVSLEARSILDTGQREHLLWRDGADELWALDLDRGEGHTLTHQLSALVLSLPTARGASRRGVPVSLEDLGLGEVDLTAPLPDAGPSLGGDL